LWIAQTLTSRWAAAAQFIPATKGGERQDTRDLLLELRGNGFDIVPHTHGFGSGSSVADETFCLFSNNDLAFAIR